MIERFGAGRSWRDGLERLEKAVSDHRALPLKEALRRVGESLIEPGPGEDDRVLMAVDA
jgi:hypothetical protein